MDKKFWGILGGLIVIAIILAVIFSGGGSNNNVSNTTPTDNVRGSTKSGITLVEYGDFECPYCAEYYPITKQVNQIYDGVIQFQFRNYPLTSIHQNALAGARAAQAAADQGKFWQMHDLLYQNNFYTQGMTGWVADSDKDPLNNYFTSFASQIGLNIAKFKTDYASAETNAKIQADLAAGDKLGIQGTPTFYLNGKQVSPAISVDSFKKILNKALTAKGIPLPAGAAVSPNAPASNAQPEQTKKAGK